MTFMTADARSTQRLKWIIAVGVVVIGELAVAGRVAATLTLTSSLSLSETYIDNLFFSPTDKVSDFGTFVGPGLALKYESKDYSILASYRGTMQLFQHQTSANRYVQDMRFSQSVPLLNERFEGFEIKVNGSLSFSPALDPFFFEPGAPAVTERSQSQQAGQVGLGNAVGSGFGSPLGGISGGGVAFNQGIVLQRSDSFQSNTGGSVSYSWSSRAHLTAALTSVMTKFTDPQFQDTTAYTGSLQYAFQSSPRTHWTATYGFGITDFSNSQSNNQSSSQFTNQSIVTQRVSGGINYQLTPTINLNGDVGVSKLEAGGGGNGGTFLRSTARATAKYETWFFSVNYFQGIGTGGGLVATPTLNQVLSSSASWVFAKDWSAYLQGAYSTNVSTSGNDIDISTYTASTGVSVLLWQGLNASINYTFIDQVSRGSFGATTDRNQIMVTLTGNTPPWRIIK